MARGAKFVVAYPLIVLVFLIVSAVGVTEIQHFHAQGGRLIH